MLVSTVLLLLVTMAGCDGKTSEATLTSITVIPACHIITNEAQQQFVAIGRYSDNTEKDLTAQVAWSSSNTSVAAVTSTGLASAATTTGTTEISVAFDGFIGRAALTVTDMVPPQSVSVTPADQRIPYGTSIQFNAEGTFVDGSKRDVTSQINWTSSDPTMQFICDAPGLAKSKAENEVAVEVSASLSGVAGKTALTIKNTDLTSVLIVPSPYAWMVSGHHKQFKAIGSFVDSSTWEITNDVVWNSSDSTVVVIDAKGFATSTYGKQGKITISATTASPLTPVRAVTSLDVAIISE